MAGTSHNNSNGTRSHDGGEFAAFVDDWKRDWIDEEGEVDTDRHDRLTQRALDFYNERRQPAGTTLYRGITVPEAMSVGDVYTEDGLGSWSEGMDMAQDFTRYPKNEGDTHGAVMMLDNAEGMPLDAENSDEWSEREWLLGGEYEVTGIEPLEDGGYGTINSRNLYKMKRKASVSFLERSPMLEQSRELVENIITQALGRLPYLIYRVVKDTPITIDYDMFGLERAYYQISSASVVLMLNGESMSTPQNMLHSLGHELWHAYTYATDFWQSDEGLELAADIGVFDEWKNDPALGATLVAMWGSSYWNNKSSRYHEYDERMATALGLTVAGDRNGQHELADSMDIIVSGLMQTYLMDRAASKTAWNNPEPAKTEDEARERFGDEFVDAVDSYQYGGGYQYGTQHDYDPILQKYHDKYKESTPKLYRGIVDFDSLREGDTYRSDNLDSWTEKKSVAEGFSDNFGESEPTDRVVMELEPGDEGLSLGRYSTEYSPEQEWLLGGDFTVDSIEERDGINHLKMKRKAWNNPEPAKTREEAVDRFGDEFVKLTEQYRSGGQDLSDAASESLVRYYDEHKEKAPYLMRGITDYNDMQVGDTYSSTGLDSWTDDGVIASSFAMGIDGGTATVLHLPEGDYGLPLGKIQSPYNYESEWLVGGDFDVVGEWNDDEDRHLLMKRRADWFDRSRAFWVNGSEWEQIPTGGVHESKPHGAGWVSVRVTDDSVYMTNYGSEPIDAGWADQIYGGLLERDAVSGRQDEVVAVWDNGGGAVYDIEYGEVIPREGDMPMWVSR